MVNFEKSKYARRTFKRFFIVGLIVFTIWAFFHEWQNIGRQKWYDYGGDPRIASEYATTRWVGNVRNLLVNVLWFEGLGWVDRPLQLVQEYYYARASRIVDQDSPDLLPLYYQVHIRAIDNSRLRNASNQNDPDIVYLGYLLETSQYFLDGVQQKITNFRQFIRFDSRVLRRAHLAFQGVLDKFYMLSKTAPTLHIERDVSFNYMKYRKFLLKEGAILLSGPIGKIECSATIDIIHSLNTSFLKSIAVIDYPGHALDCGVLDKIKEISLFLDDKKAQATCDKTHLRMVTSTVKSMQRTINAEAPKYCLIQ